MCLSKILPHWSKEYIYFNATNELQTVRLNVFKRIARFFGAYAHTRLSTVASQAYKASLSNSFQAIPVQHQQILKVIGKANKAANQAHHTEVFKTPFRGEEMKVGLRYNISKIYIPSGTTAKISSISFNFSFPFFGISREGSDVVELSFYKENQQIIVCSSNLSLTYFSVKDKNKPLVGILDHKALLISDFIKKVLIPSNLLQSMEVVCYPEKYTPSPPFGFSSGSAAGASYDYSYLNKTQVDEMLKVGWEQDKNDQDSDRNKYRFNQNLPIQNPEYGHVLSRNLSLAFAAEHLV